MPTPARGETDPRAPSAPAPLLTAASVVVVEAVLLLGLGVLELASLDERRLIMGLTTAAFFVGAACGLLACAWALKTLQRWGRGPVMLAQLMCLGLAWNLWDDATRTFSIVLGVLGIVAIAGIVHPASMAALEWDADGEA